MNRQSNRRIVWRALEGAFAAFLLLLIVPGQARAEGIWCVLMDVVDNTQPRSVYSAVFEGDPQEAQAYELAFWSHVDSRVGLGFRPQATCSWEDTISEARRARDESAARARNTHGRSIHFTYWAY